MPALEVNRNVLAFSGCLRVDRARARWEDVNALLRAAWQRQLPKRA